MKKIILASLALSSLLVAEEHASETHEEKSFATHAELSYMNTNGNTKSQSFAADFAAEKEFDVQKIRLHADAIYSEVRNEETRETVTDKNRYSASANYDYGLTEYFALNYMVEDIHDKFSGYDNRFNTGPGVIVHAITSETQTLNLQSNIFYTRDSITNELNEKEVESYASYFLALEYSLELSENITFKQEATYEQKIKDSEVFFAFSKTALEIKIDDYFSMGASYKVDYSNIKLARYHTDRVFLLSLILDY